MAGWYAPNGAYKPEELHGLPVDEFVKAVSAELGGYPCSYNANFCLHTHNFFKTFDYYNKGVPTRIAFNDRDVRVDDDACKPSEKMYSFSVPWFKCFDKEWIEKFAQGYRNVIENHMQLVNQNSNGDAEGGRWYGFENQ